MADSENNGLKELIGMIERGQAGAKVEALGFVVIRTDGSLMIIDSEDDGLRQLIGMIEREEVQTISLAAMCTMRGKGGTIKCKK